MNEIKRKKMEERKVLNEKIVTWIKNKVKTEYADDISLVLIYGSYLNGTANHKSDVDCYFIPKTERGYHMAVTFTIDGVGYDIFPISWERATGIADLQENMSPLIGDVQIVYYSDAEDLERFKALQERLKRNLFNEEYVREIAVKRCEDANKMCAWMNASHRESDIRKMAGIITMTLADVIAVYHHEYFHYGLKKQFEDLQNNFPNVPQDIIKGYKHVIEARCVDDVKNATMTMFYDVCKYLNISLVPQKVSGNEVLEAGDINVSWLAGLYEEISSTFNKIYVCCESGNYVLAFLSAVCLQNELDEAREAGCPIYDLLSGFDYKALEELALKAKRVESDFVRLITGNGGNIKRYDSFEQFLQAGL